MTVPAALAFPGARSLAGWWRQLAPCQPRSLWVGHLLLHRVEALAVVARSDRLDPLHRLVLQAMSRAPDGTLEGIEENLRPGRPLLGQALDSLRSDGLAAFGAGWTVTERGRRALETGAYARAVPERRPFYFVHGERADSAPHFLHLDATLCLPWTADADWRFDAAWLADCLAQPEDWKQRFRFPPEVSQIVTINASQAADDPPPWRRVLVDRPERLPVALALTEDGRLLGFAVRPDNGTLQGDAPAFSLEEGWRDVFPRVADEPPAEDWLCAWHSWCQPRGLTGAGLDPVDLRPEGHRLIVTAPPKLMERLRSTRSDALRGEAWVLAGNGWLRRAAMLEVVEESPPGAAGDNAAE